MKTNKIFYLLALSFLGCTKVDNSELIQSNVEFINHRDEMVEVQLKETGGVFDVLPHDSINFPESSGKPTLLMTYKAFIYPGRSQEFICERNVYSRNVFDYQN